MSKKPGPAHIIRLLSLNPTSTGRKIWDMLDRLYMDTSKAVPSGANLLILVVVV